MNKRIIYFLIAIASLNLSIVKAQSKLGIQYINEERWWSAEKEFSKSKTDEDIFYLGFSQMKMEDVDKAKTTFNSIATKPYGKIGLGWVELNAGNRDGANKLFQSAADETKNKNPEVFMAISRAIANSTSSHKEDAIEWAKKAVDMNKSNSDYRQIWGDAYLSNLDGGSAINQYEYAQQYAPTGALPLAKIGRVYYRSRTYGLALENLNKALEKDPNNLFALKYLAEIYYRYKRYDTARIYQSKIIELGDKNPEDMRMIADIHFMEKDYDGAINIINEIIKGNNKYNYLNRLIGYSYQETGKPSEAVSFLEKFLQTQPKDKIIASDFEYLGKAYMSMGDTAKGIETMKKAIELNPNDKEAIKAFAEFLKKSKQYEEALVYYKKLTEMPEPSSDDFFQLAGMYYTKKDYTNAEAAYTKVLEMSPNSSGTYYQRAGVRMMLDPEQTTSSAKPDYEKFIELTVGKEEKFKKQIVKAKIYMAKDALLKLNDKEKAKVFVDEILLLDPSNSELPALQEGIK